MQYQTSCFGNSSVWPVNSKEDDRDYALRMYQGWLLLPFVATSLPLTSLYIFASVRAIRSRSVSRKFSALLINRAIGDFFASFVSFAAVLYLLISVNHISVHWITFLNSFFTSCFWSGLITYTSIGFLKLYGIAKPFQYKEMVTMERCVMFIKLSWLCFALIMLATMGFTFLVKIEFLANWTGCKVENCLSWMYRVRNIFTILLYFSTLFCFVVTVVLIKKAKQRSGTLRAGTLNSEQQQRCFRRRYQFPLVKLSLGVGTFAIFHLPYTLWMIALMFSSNCYFILHYNLMQISLGLIRLFVLIRIILDVFVGFMDKELRREVFQLFRFCSVSKPTQNTLPKLSTTTNSGVLSSDSMPTENCGAAIERNGARRKETAYNKAQNEQQQKKKTKMSSVKIVPKTAEDKTGEVKRKWHSERRESMEMEERPKTN
ncbi:hypothetical protein niasHT_005158 [Heterodera trifolii]|uniref:G-protein coupled receptors family 1 profile domain-containing protein n=1 Tax=Heterodera trifolii TaxID=157864 RepID=A0ABD2LRP7_9BILA